MKYICSECLDLIKEDKVICQSIRDEIRFMCPKCYNKWFGEELEVKK